MSDKQSGFRKGHSTTTCLVEFLNELYRNTDEGKITGVLFLDLRKAFDTVDHHTLLCKLEQIGLGESFVAYISDYLIDRRQVTRVNNVISSTGDIVCGVPQGSILGPLLFITYINSLPDTMPDNVQTYLYADDTAILATGTTADEVSIKLTDALNTAKTWFDSHVLSLNTSKTKCMKFGSSHKLNTTAELNVKVDNTQIDNVSVFKYLGVQLDSQLKFDRHVLYIRRKVFTKLKAIGRLRQSISKGLALQLYTSMVIPHFDYAYVVYDGMSKGDAAQLEVLQNKCLRLCLKSEPKTRNVDLRKEAGVQSLSDRRMSHTCNVVYQGAHNISTPGINAMFTTCHEVSERNTRHNNNGNVVKPNTRLGLARRNAGYRGVVYHNALPTDIKTACSLNSFKSKMKKHLSTPVT